MHIGKKHYWRKEGECFGLGVETIQTTVLRTNPQNTLIILTELTYSFPTQTSISPLWDNISRNTYKNEDSNSHRQNKSQSRCHPRDPYTMNK